MLDFGNKEIYQGIDLVSNRDTSMVIDALTIVPVLSSSAPFFLGGFREDPATPTVFCKVPTVSRKVPVCSELVDHQP